MLIRYLLYQLLRFWPWTFEIIAMKTLAGLKMGLFYEWWQEVWEISNCKNELSTTRNLEPQRNFKITVHSYLVYINSLHTYLILYLESKMSSE